MQVRAMRSIHALLGAVLLVTLVGASAAASAQAGGSRQVVSGQTITWPEAWTEEEGGIATESVELVALRHEAGAVRYGGTSAPVEASQLRDGLLEGIASGQAIRQVDRGAYDNVSYSVDLTTVGGDAVAIFTLVVENPSSTSIAVLIAAPDRFAEAMAAAQGGIAVDGAPIFDGVDGAAMQATILAAAPAGAESATPAPMPASTPLEGGSTPGNVETIASSGAEVRYSDDWMIERENDTTISLGTVGQPAALVSVIDLGPVDESPDASALASGLQQQVESLADAEIVAAVNPSPERVVIVFRDPSTTGTLYRIYDIVLDPAATTAVTLIVGEGELDAGVTLASATILVNGEPVLRDIRELVPQLFSAG